MRDEEGERLLEHLGSKRVMLLKNHGILVMGKTLPEAFIKHWSLQRACEIQLATMSMGKPLVVDRGRHQGPPARPLHGAGHRQARRGGLRRDGAQGRQDRHELARLMLDRPGGGRDAAGGRGGAPNARVRCTAPAVSRWLGVPPPMMG